MQIVILVSIPSCAFHRNGVTIHMDEPVYYTVGELSQAYGLPSSTLRFYDKHGVFVPEYRNPQNGYRYYSGKQLIKLDVILFLLELGVSIHKISEILGCVSTRNDLVEIIQEYSEELEEQEATILARQKKISEIVGAFPPNPPALGIIEERLFPERLLYCHEVSVLSDDGGERRLKFKQWFNNRDPRQSLPVDMLSMGGISSLAQFKRDGAVKYKYLYREGSSEDRHKQLLPITMPAGKYLATCFSNEPEERLSAYIRLLQYLDMKNLHASDEAIESFTVIGMPPVTLQEDIVELQLRIK